MDDRGLSCLTSAASREPQGMLGTSCVLGQSYSWSSLVCYSVGRGRTHTNTHSHPCPTNKNSPDKSPIGSLACIQHTLRSIWRASTLEAKLNVMQSILPMLHCQGYRRGTCVQSMCGKTRNGPTNQSLIMIHLVILIIFHKWIKKICSVWCSAVCMKSIKSERWAENGTKTSFVSLMRHN